MKAIKAIISSLLVMPLIILEVVLVALLGARVYLKSGGISTLVESINYNELIEENPEIFNSLIEKSNIPSGALEIILEDEEVVEMLGSITENMILASVNNNYDLDLPSKEEIVEVIYKHKDEISVKYPEFSTMTKEELLENFTPIYEEIISSVNVYKDDLSGTNFYETLALVTGNKVVFTLIAIIIGIFLIFFALYYKSYAYLLWFGIPSTIAFMPYVTMSLGINYLTQDSSSTVLGPLLQKMIGRFMLYGAIGLIISIGCIVLYSIISKKKQVKQLT